MGATQELEKRLREQAEQPGAGKTTKGGKGALQLTYHASAHKNCTPAPLATFDVLQPPKLGILTVRRALLTTNKVAMLGTASSISSGKSCPSHTATGPSSVGRSEVVEPAVAVAASVLGPVLLPQQQQRHDGPPRTLIRTSDVVLHKTEPNRRTCCRPN
jgi:hypothetical protein